MSKGITELVDSMMEKTGWFQDIQYPYAYAFFLDLKYLDELVEGCREIRKSGLITLPPCLIKEAAREHIRRGFSLSQHMDETASHIQRVLSSEGDRDPLYKSKQRHSFELERLYHAVFYGCVAHIKEFQEPVKTRPRTLPKQLVREVLREGGLSDYYSIEANSRLDCELSVASTNLIYRVQLFLGSWGRELLVKVEVDSSSVIYLSEFFGVSTSIYVHNKIEMREAILAVLQIIKSINNTVKY